MTNATLRGKPYAGNPHVRFDEGEVASAKPRRGSLLYKNAVGKASLSERVIALIESARQKVAATVNVAQVYTNFEIGRMIVEEEQGGKRRAGYGEKILIDLSVKLTARYGRGWSAENLRKMRAFFLMYSDIHNSVVDIRADENEIHNAVVEISGATNSLNTVDRIPQFALSWSHYLVLMRIADVERPRQMSVEWQRLGSTSNIVVSNKGGRKCIL